MADQKPEVTLGYARSKGQYHVGQIRGKRPVAFYERSTDVPYLGSNATVVEMETVTVHVGDWLSENDAHALGSYAVLIVKPYRLDA